MICFVVIAASIFQSCDDKETYDVVGNPSNIIYINTQQWSSINEQRNQFTFEIVHTPSGDFGTVLAKFPIRSTKPLNKAVTLKVEVDNSLVVAYNKSYGTTCAVLPDGILDLSKAIASISEGKCLSADSITISMDKSKLALLTQQNYLIPVKLSTISRSDFQISSDYSTVYLAINTSTKIIKDNVGSGTMVGSLETDYSGWTVTSDPASAGNAFADIFDGSTDSYWQFDESEVTLTVNLKTVKKISGFRLYTQYASYGYIFSNIQVSISKDNVTFDVAGTCTDSTMANESGYQYIGFYGGVEARYVKLKLQWKYPWFHSLCELGVYTN